MKTKNLRMAATILSVVLLLGIKAQARPVPTTSAHAAVLLDGTTGRVLYAHNETEPNLIASTTKIMTGLLVAEHCNLEDRVAIPQEAVGVEGSSLYLKAGEIMSVRDLLYGVMLQSGNDAATALAIYCAGSAEAFVRMMNERADALGLRNTSFANPSGLDHDENYASALDLARLTAHAMENAIFRETVSCKSVTIGNRVLTNHNKLLWRYNGTVGVKTGFTKKAGRILVSAAEREGRRLIAVTLRDGNDWADHTTMLDYGFDAYESVCITNAGSFMGRIPVLSGKEDTVCLKASGSFCYPLMAGETIALELHTPRFVFAPVTRGDPAGFAAVILDGCKVSEIPLCYGDCVFEMPRRRLSILERILGGSHG